nr:MAG TPA: hypothetical protein [Caudoviricetes sp.]
MTWLFHRVDKMKHKNKNRHSNFLISHIFFQNCI